MQSLAKLVSTLFYILFKDPSQLRYFGRWVGSLWFRASRRGFYSLKADVPSYTFSAIDEVKRHVGSDSKIFEYGSGGSTLFYARRAALVHAVEHDALWARTLATELEAQKLSNVTLVLREGEETSGNSPKISSARTNYAGLDFEKYVMELASFDEGTFDVVVVDGRARSECLRVAAQYVKKGGYVVLDNSERARYFEAMDEMTGFERKDHAGLGIFGLAIWRTTIWRKL